jgi:hypothetical protein
MKGPLLAAPGKVGTGLTGLCQAGSYAPHGALEQLQLGDNCWETMQFQLQFALRAALRAAVSGLPAGC